MNIVVFGSRGISSYGTVQMGIIHALSNYGLSGEDIRKATLISGGAKGVDRLGEKFAQKFGLNIKRFIPDWNGLGRRAGMVRNKQMADISDIAVGLWDGESSGTRQMKDYCIEIGLPVYFLNQDKWEVYNVNRDNQWISNSCQH